METILYMQNLKCGGCANTIIKNVTLSEGIENIMVNVEESVVSFSYSNESQLTTVQDKLKTLGYPEDGEAKSYVSYAIGKIN